jgi:DNA replication protein DnaC
MAAFLKIDDCTACGRSLPWEWTPAVLSNGKTFAGTGVWRSQLVNGRCPACLAEAEAQRQKEERLIARRGELVKLLGGEMPYREFTFERFRITPENKLAYERSRHFDPASENLYLWGACGVGKTHLSYACARHGFEETLSVEIVRAPQISRRVRMKGPDEEQAAVEQLIGAEVLVLDDLGKGPDTAFARQILQEVLDGRTYRDRAGLIVASPYSPDMLAAKFGDDAISSRLAGACAIIEMRGTDGRLTIRTESP